MQQPKKSLKFSVIIPVYNGEATIGRAIDSVLAQTFAPHEIIIVDDAGTDGTCVLIRTKYADKVILIEKKINEGSSAARNNGMDIATGDYIAFLDADDIWHKDKLRLVNTVLSVNPGIVLFFNRFTQDNIEDKELPAEPDVTKLSIAR